MQEYTDDIIELIVNQYMDPSDVCEAIGLCPWVADIDNLFLFLT